MISPEQLAEDAAAQRPVPTDEELGHVASLAREQFRLERTVVQMETELVRVKKDLARVSERELPDAMRALGLTDFALEGGYRVTVADEYYANIPSADSEDESLLERRRSCFAWLRANNSGDLIKSDLKASFGRGDDARAATFLRLAEEAQIPVKQTETVHHSTLKAFVKDRLVKGKPIPEETFGVCVKRVATLTKKKG